MYRFLIVIEKADGNYSAYSPDLPGCVATGKTREQTTRNMYEAIEIHVRGLVEDKLPVPKSHAFAEYIAVPAYRRTSANTRTDRVTYAAFSQIWLAQLDGGSISRVTSGVIGALQRSPAMR